MIKRLFVRLSKFKLIFDSEPRLGNFSIQSVSYKVGLIKEQVCRDFILGRSGKGMHFLDVGARDGKLDYLLGIKENHRFCSDFYNENKKLFLSKYHYFGMDLDPIIDSKVLCGDACDPQYLNNNPEYYENFDVIYSNNVFEHFKKPWIAAKNLSNLLKPGGLMVTVVPFSQRYHESPGDYYRYTHKGVEEIFHSAASFEVLESGYDIEGRRINWQGTGNFSDIVPVDKFGAWRETWYVVCVMRKILKVE